MIQIRKQDQEEKGFETTLINDQVRGHFASPLWQHTLHDKIDFLVLLCIDTQAKCFASHSDRKLTLRDRQGWQYSFLSLSLLSLFQCIEQRPQHNQKQKDETPSQQIYPPAEAPWELHSVQTLLACHGCGHYHFIIHASAELLAYATHA